MKQSDCLAMILGGGRGTRLYPLTLERSKPAIGFAGKYRIIDIPISNCINSGFNKIFVLTQFLSASLHGHIMDSYRFDNFSKGFVEILSAEQSHDSLEWFQGTADAVRRVRRHIRNLPQKNVLILSGDHLYKMDYRKLMASHLKKNADVTVASIYVNERDAPRMGIIDCDESGKVTQLIEKPKKPGELVIESKVKSNDGDEYLASMGIYLFKKDALLKILEDSNADDFGHHILPLLISKKYDVFIHKFKGYWRDIGTVGSYYEASLDLISAKPQFDLFDETWPLFTHARFLPPGKIVNSMVENALVADGGYVKNAKIKNSIIGLRSRIGTDTSINDSIIMGNDYYQAGEGNTLVKPGIGKGVIIERAIVDKNVKIGDGCHISNKQGKADCDYDLYCVRDGITIIRRGVILPEGTII